MTDIISLDDHRMTHDMVSTLRHSAGQCSVCDRTWKKHTTGEIIDHCIEISRRRNVERLKREPPPPLVDARTHSLEHVVDAVASVLPNFGMPQPAATAAARAVMVELARLGLIR